MENIVTISEINNINSELYCVTALCNKNILLDPYLADMLSPSSSLRRKIITRVRKYDFDVFLEDYGCNLQRPYVWETVQQTEFLISLIKEKPIESFIVINKSLDLDDKNTVVEVIDGKQRLLTIKKFLDGEIGIHLPDRVLYYKDFDKNAKNLFHFKSEQAHRDCLLRRSSDENLWRRQDQTLQLLQLRWHSADSRAQESSERASRIRSEI